MLVVFRIGVTFLSSSAGENSEPTQRASVVRKAVDSTEDPFPDLTENPPPSQSGKDGFSEGTVPSRHRRSQSARSLFAGEPTSHNTGP
ncbi:hypothetical protein EOD39_17365 [Acipenser ruthenus]|uniref:Uncharacterized protein n=1 Tax=Acipenser ruthenus TaxID=7906 RepID=A0A444V3L6_ACIRT|nr:hypothetical protein EOD39_17365 [Acipenser ruthenus]